MTARALLLVLATTAATLLPAGGATAAGRWLAPVQVGGERATDVRAGSTAAGEALIAFNREGPGGEQVLVSTRTPGRSLSEPRTVYSAAPGEAVWFLDLAVSRRGDALVVWQATSGPAVRRILASFRPAGGEFGPAEVVPAPAGASPMEPRAALDERRGAVVAWADGRTSGPRFYAAVRSPGGVFSEAQALPGQRAPYGSVELAAGPEGHAVAAWREWGERARTAVRAAARPPEGSFQPAGVVSGDDSAGAQLAVAAGPDMAALVLWTASSSDPAPMDGPYDRVRYSIARAGPFSPPATLADVSGRETGLGEPAAAFDADGDARAAWLAFAPGTQRLQTALLPAGASWFGPPLDVEGSDGAYGAVDVAFDGRRRGALGWRASSRKGIVVRVSQERSGEFERAPVSLATESPSEPEIGFDDEGNGIAAWSAIADTWPVARAAVYDAAAPLVSRVSVRVARASEARSVRQITTCGVRFMVSEPARVALRVEETVRRSRRSGRRIVHRRWVRVSRGASVRLPRLRAGRYRVLLQAQDRNGRQGRTRTAAFTVRR